LPLLKIALVGFDLPCSFVLVFTLASSLRQDFPFCRSVVLLLARTGSSARAPFIFPAHGTLYGFGFRGRPVFCARVVCLDFLRFPVSCSRPSCLRYDLSPGYLSSLVIPRVAWFVTDSSFSWGSQSWRPVPNPFCHHLLAARAEALTKQPGASATDLVQPEERALFFLLFRVSCSICCPISSLSECCCGFCAPRSDS
jgi:hypothetical protein